MLRRTLAESWPCFTEVLIGKPVWSAAAYRSMRDAAAPPAGTLTASRTAVYLPIFVCPY